MVDRKYFIPSSQTKNVGLKCAEQFRLINQLKISRNNDEQISWMEREEEREARGSGKGYYIRPDKRRREDGQITFQVDVERSDESKSFWGHFSEAIDWFFFVIKLYEHKSCNSWEAGWGKDTIIFFQFHFSLSPSFETFHAMDDSSSSIEHPGMLALLTQSTWLCSFRDE